MLDKRAGETTEEVEAKRARQRNCGTEFRELGSLRRDFKQAISQIST